MTPNPTEEQTSPLTLHDFLARRREMLARYPGPDNAEITELTEAAEESGARAAWDARQPEIDRLRAALERYGQHDHDCAWVLFQIEHYAEPEDGPPCSCGLDQALDG